jgi:spore coat protein CotH
MKKIIFAFALLTCAASVRAQNLYDPNVLQEIKITFYQSNWDHLLDSLKNIDDGSYLLAPSVEINGQVFDSVGVKYKGNSSYNANNQKNPMHIELDFVRKSQNYQGIEDIKLSNGFSDPTFVREPLSYEILRQYTEAPRSNHAKVWINGAYWGLYGNVESINKRFIRSHFKTDGNNPFFKCNPEDFGGPGSSNFPDLVYSSADSAAYYNRYDIKSDYGWKELLHLMDTLKNVPGQIDQLLDVDRALWMLAFNTLLVNLDSYTGAFGQNYYLYYDRNERWLTFNWDLNMSFGGFPLLNAGGGGGGLSLTQMKQLDPLVQSTNNSRPLIKQLLANPTYKRKYIAHMRTMLKENFSDESYKDRALEMQAIIDAAVQADTRKFYSYNSFIQNITQSVAGGFGNTPGITDLMNARSSFLTSNSNFTAVPPTISDITTQLGTVVRVNARVQQATSVVVAWRADTSDVFTNATMFDDGLHNDGAANDGVYSGKFPLEDATMQYYIYAENDQAGIFAPERAEHEFYVTQFAVPNVGELVINELLADNTNDQVDEAGEHEDWVELFNNTTSPITLTGIYLSDDPLDRNKWALPAGTSIPPLGFVTVWLDNDTQQGQFHANFKLSAAGESVILSDGGDILLDQVNFGQQTTDVSLGRFPNGTGPFAFMPTTFNTFNVLSVSTHEPGAVPSVQVFPNPAQEAITVSSTDQLPSIRVVNMLGQTISQWESTGAFTVNLSVQQWAEGMYLLQAGNNTVKIVVKH